MSSLALSLQKYFQKHKVCCCNSWTNSLAYSFFIGTIKVVVPPTPAAPPIAPVVPPTEDGLGYSRRYRFFVSQEIKINAITGSPMAQSVPPSPAVPDIEITIPQAAETSTDQSAAKPARGGRRKVQFEEQPDEKVDPFNLSMDYLYKNKVKDRNNSSIMIKLTNDPKRSKILLRKSTGIPAVHHSLPALKVACIS